MLYIRYINNHCVSGTYLNTFNTVLLNCYIKYITDSEHLPQIKHIFKKDCLQKMLTVIY